MSATVVLITGANRGLGLGLAKRFLALKNHIVIASIRNPSSSQALSDLPKGNGSKLIIVKIDATADKDPFDAVAELQQKHDITHLDIVIANAGVSFSWPTVAEASLDEVRQHFAPNVFGVVALYQATRGLLEKSSKKEPIFAPVGSSAGLIGNQPPVPNGTYGPTKAAVNWYTVRINAEDAWLNAFVLDPGLVQTDLGLAGARHLGFPDEVCIPVDVSCDGMFKILAETSKEKHGGKMIGIEGDDKGY
ncbi:hypothetical protein E8E14_001049 [Neopestalotiopsis sp. 37M]|nr:hypothetical protein E8E14_001049 [Neopestalotiopsis sp. 37M]